MMNIYDTVYTPRFCSVQITEMFDSREEAEKAGYTEPAYWQDPNYGIAGKSIDACHMEFAGYVTDRHLSYEEDGVVFRLTDCGIAEVEACIREMKAMRKELSDAGYAVTENIPSFAELFDDVTDRFSEEDGVWSTVWSVSDECPNGYVTLRLDPETDISVSYV